MSLRLKTNLFFGMLLIVSLLTTTGILISNARHSVHVKVESAMMAAEHLVTVAMPPTHSRNSPAAHQRMARLVEALSDLRGIYIMVYRSGQLLYAGGHSPDETLKPPKLFVKLLTPTIKPLIKRSAGGAIVIYSAPEQEISERWVDIRTLLILGTGLSFFIILLLYVGINRILKPLEFLSGALSGFEKGDLHLRLPKFSLSEMDHISDAFNRMGEALQSSAEENQRLAMLVKQSRDAIFSLDHDGNIIFYNPAAENLFPELDCESLGNSLLNLDFGKYQDRICEVIECNETLVNLEIVLSREDLDQGIIDLLLSMSPLFNIDENATGFICTIRDVTQHKQAEAAERQLHESRLLTQHISNVQENERRSLARELHDELGQCLTAIKTDAVLIRNRIRLKDAKISDSAQAIIDVASHIYDVVHHMLSRLRPTPLDDLGLVLTLQGTISTWQKRQPDISFDLDLKGPLDHLNETMNMTIFRIIQESITNAVRHANASKIIISVHNMSNKGQLIMDISDDGKGMIIKDFYSDVDFGILGMRERIQSMEGNFKLISGPGKGVNIQISIPA